MDIRIKITLFLLITVPFLGVPVHAAQENASVQTAPTLIWSASTGNDALMSERTGVSCSGDGERIVTGYGRGIIELRDANGTILWQWQSPHPYYTVWSVAISGDGNTVVALLYDPMQDHPGEVICFDRSGAIRWKNFLNGPFGFVTVSFDGTTVAVADGSRLGFFDAAGNRTGTTVFEGGMWSIALAEDGTYAVAGITTRDYAGNLYVTSANGTNLWSSSSPRRLTLVAVSGDSRYLAGADQNQIRYFTAKGDRLWRYNSSPRITGIAVSSDGGYVAVTSQYFVRYFNKSGTLLWQYEPPSLPTRPGPYFSHPAMSSGGDYVTASSDGNRTFFFNREGTILWQNQSQSWVRGLCMSRNGKYLAIGTGQDIRYFDTGIEIDPVTPQPERTTNTSSSVPVTTRTPESPIAIFIVLLSVCMAMVVMNRAKR